MDSHPLLSHTETLALIARYQSTGDEDAFNRLLAHNERLLVKIANKYFLTGASGDAQMDDLVQWGRMGFLRALQTFDPATGNKFSTYVYWWVRLYIGRWGVRGGQSLVTSYGAIQKKYKIATARAMFLQDRHREPTNQELHEITGIVNIDKLRAITISLDGTDLTLEPGDNAPDSYLVDNDTDVADEAARAADKSFNLKIHQHIADLPENMRIVITMYYGIGQSNPQSLDEIAAKLGLTHQRVKQIEKEALEKLKTIENLSSFSHDIG